MFPSYAAAAGVLGLSTVGFVGDWAMDVMRPNILLTVEELKVTQAGEVEIERRVINDGLAQWAAAVERFEGGRSVVICAGAGTADYRRSEAKRQKFTLQEFVAPECPERLAPGDVLVVSWFPLRDELRPTRVAANVPP